MYPCESCELVNDLEERMSPCKRKVQTQDGDQRKSLLRMQAFSGLRREREPVKETEKTAARATEM